MKEQGEPTPEGTEWTAPIHILDAIRALDPLVAAGPGMASAKPASFAYSELSDFSHPNMGTFSLYHDFVEIAGVSVPVMNSEPEHKVPWSAANMALALFAYGASAVLKLPAPNDAIALKLDTIYAALRAPTVNGP